VTLMPLYGFVEGDTMGVVVLARSDGTAHELGEEMIAAASVRVARRGRFKVMFHDRALEPGATLRMQGLSALERVDLVWE
jgi:hypothetical protein